MVSQRARELHFSSVVVDTHSDQLGWAVDKGEDLAADTPGRQSTFARLKAGGVSGQFFAAYLNHRTYDSRDMVQGVLRYFDAMHTAVERHSDVIEIARTAADVRRLAAQGKLAAILCIEGGHAIQDDLAALRMFHQLGARYLTLTWNNTNNWADGVLDDARHGGLTGFGKDVVREMNRMGMIVDLSHAAVSTFWDAIETTSRPVLASHSCASAICGHPRNLNDDQLRAVAANGGVACATFVTQFVSESVRVGLESLRLNAYPQTAEERQRYTQAEGELAMPGYAEIVDHVDHMVRVAGVDHVGLGSDFGVLTSTPVGMEDASRYPWITEELLRRGYSDGDVRKVLGENVLRLMKDVIGE